LTIYRSAIALAFAVLPALVATARAGEVVTVRPDVAAIDLSSVVDLQHSNNGRVQVRTPPGFGAIARQIEVLARAGGTNWGVLTLVNNTDEQLDRFLAPPPYKGNALGRFAPTGRQPHIVAVTANTGTADKGYLPNRISTETGDYYDIVLDPGSVTTLILELTTGRLPDLLLWDREAYQAAQANALARSKQLNAVAAALLTVLLIAALFSLWRNRHAST
jgi:hypothetical protein